MGVTLNGSNGGDNFGVGVTTNSADSINALGGDDTVLGLGGNDTLLDGDGNDTVSGGSGNDSLMAGAGADSIDGGVGNDTINYIGLANGVIVNLSSNAADDGSGLEVLLNVEAIFGSLHNDSLAGNLANNTVNGWSGADSIFGAGGDDALAGHFGADTIDGGEGNDSILGEFNNDLLLGGAGADTLDGGGENDRLSGGTGNDILAGGAGADSLDGGADADSLIGGSEDDTLAGGDGADTLLGGTYDDSLTGGGGANVLRGESGGDTLVGGAFGDLLAPGDDNDEDMVDGGLGEDTLSYADVTVALVVDLAQGYADGAGFDLIEGIEAVIGGAGNDLLIGAEGNDSLAGGGGADTLIGGSGDDHLVVNAAGGGSIVQIVDPGAGDDTVEGVFGTIVDYSSLNGGVFINLTLDDKYAVGVFTGGDEFTDVARFVGTTGADTFRGSDAPAELFRGGAGDDEVSDEGGIDTLEGGEGFDLLDYSALATNLLIDLETPGGQSATFSGVILDSIAGFEAVEGGSGGDTLIGGGGNNSLSGGGGNDLLQGEGGADTLRAGAGVDTLDGGEGDDLLLASGGTVMGGAGADTHLGDGGRDVFFEGGGNDLYDGGGGFDGVSYASLAVTAGIRLDMATAHLGVNLGAEAGVDKLIGIFSVTGTGMADTLLGSNFNGGLSGGDGADTMNGRGGDDNLSGDDGADTLDGGSGNDGIDGGSDNDLLTGNLGDDFMVGSTGNDTLRGGAGNDVMDGGAGIDMVDFIGSTAAVTVALGAGTASGSFSGVDQLLRIENVSATNLADLVTGGAWANTLVGLAGADTLSGLGGADSLVGGNHNDLLIGGTGADTLDGGAGIDTASWAGANKGQSVSLGLGASFGSFGADVLIGIENAIGSDHGDTLAGSDLGNLLAGGGEGDRLSGWLGADTLLGGAGADTLDGGTGNDLLRFTAPGESGQAMQDVVQFFEQGLDRFDLSAIDAKPSVAGEQAFVLVAARTLGAEGEITQVQGVDFTNVLVYVDADETPDLWVRVESGAGNPPITFTVADFIL